MSVLRTQFLIAVIVLLLAAPSARAAQVTLAWDANTETDVSGYIVEYGPASAPFSLATDVGNTTTWTFATALPGTTYSFRVIAYNVTGQRSDASDVVSTVTPGGPTLTVDRTQLAFGIAGTVTTPSQTIRLTQAGAGSVTWAVASTVSWLQVAPTGGVGSGAFTVTLVPGAVPLASTSGLLTISAAGTSNVIEPIPVLLTVLPAGASAAPIGAVDTPANNTTGVTGSLAITGWALDDVNVSHVRIYRDAVAGETPGQLIYIGEAIRVEDARPDVATAFPGYPANYKGGWGYLALTNMLPARGNGTFRLVVYAEDSDGHATLLGTRTITCTNGTATQPFGAIDTPAPGETVGGGLYLSFGWVLSRGPRRADVPGGGSATVLIDGIPAGTPSGWSARPDLTALFPASEYPGVTYALAAFAFDASALSNGIHTMAWIVQDDHGSMAGIGSRYFRVFNGTSAITAAASSASALRGVSVESEVASASSDVAAIEGRRGFVLDAPFRSYEPDSQGVVVVQAEELDRVELKTTGATAGYLRVGEQLRPLPIGSRLDAGVFVWQPGPGFVGSYDLVFVRSGSRGLVKQDVRVVLNPKGSNRAGPQLIVDITEPFVAGWAADLDSTLGTGIDTIHVWAYPVTATGRGEPVFVGPAAYGGARPDVAAVYGERFLNSGYGISVDGLAPGTYDLALFAWSSATHDFLPAKVVRVTLGARSTIRP